VITVNDVVSKEDPEKRIRTLQESEQRLRTVIENLNDGLVIAATDGQLLHWNKPALEMHGFSDSTNSRSRRSSRSKTPTGAEVE
jgi:PAS domain-containing protein